MDNESSQARAVEPECHYISARFSAADNSKLGRAAARLGIPAGALVALLAQVGARSSRRFCLDSPGRSGEIAAALDAENFGTPEPDVLELTSKGRQELLKDRRVQGEAP